MRVRIRIRIRELRVRVRVRVRTRVRFRVRVDYLCITQREQHQMTRRHTKPRPGSWVGRVLVGRRFS